MNLELTGVLFSAGDSVQVSDKLTKREFVLQVEEVDGDFTKTQYYPMQLLNKNADKVTQADTGKTVSVKANLDGRSFTRKTGEPGFMLGITAWYVKFDEDAAISIAAEEVEDDLPF